jgi:hypothetical protein
LIWTCQKGGRTSQEHGEQRGLVAPDFLVEDESFAAQERFHQFETLVASKLNRSAKRQYCKESKQQGGKHDQASPKF